MANPNPFDRDRELTIDQKFQALQALSNDPRMVSIHRREGVSADKAWALAVPGVYIRDTPCSLTCGVPSGESTPEGAVHAAWEWFTKLPKAPHQYIVTLSADGQQRKAYLWAGFMWQEVDEKKEEDNSG